MKIFATLTLATLLTAGLGAAAQAAPIDEYFGVEATELTPPMPSYAGGHPYTRCHGRTSGTADAACGTMTGGPSGGLF